MSLKRVSVFIAVFTLAFSLISQESDQKDRLWDLSISTDIAFSPANEYIEGPTHFSPLTEKYSGLGARVIFHGGVTINTPLGESFLLRDANVALKTDIELTPVTILPGVEIVFTPFPFLIVSTGYQIGFGWTFRDYKGVAVYKNQEYVPSNGLDNIYNKIWAKLILQFDTGAVLPGDWNHFQIQYTYQPYYSFLTGALDSDIWMWQLGTNYYNGWSQYQCLIMTYQMPLVLYRIGTMVEFNNHYSDKSLADEYKNFNGKFRNASLSPFMQFNFSKKDSLIALITISSRRSFSEKHYDAEQEPLLTCCGSEWYLNRLAFSWTHIF